MPTPCPKALSLRQNGEVRKMVVRFPKSSFPYLCALGGTSRLLGPWTSPFLAPRMPYQAPLFTVPFVGTFLPQVLISHVCVCVCVCVARSCPTSCDPMDCSLPVSFFHGFLQSRILEWVATPFSRGFSQPRDQT